MPTAIDESASAARRIARFVAGFDLDDAPEELVRLSEAAFVDTVGVMLAGTREPAARIVCDMVANEGAAPAATVVGRALRTSAQNAAFANGVATQALDFDLSFMIGQSTAALIPCLLPLAESGGAGARDAIAAYIVGAEVCGALARTFPTLSSEGGWHGAGVLGSVAAAAAAARLARQPPDAIAAILGIAASMSSGISANFGTMTKPLHAGLAARNGVMAASLGGRGFTGSEGALDGPAGLFSCFARGHAWDAAPFGDLGRRFCLLDPGYKIKPFACGGLLHCAIEAALRVREKAAPAPNDIARVTIGTSPHANNRLLDRYPWSEDSARFSPRYLIAYALIHGAPGVAAFTEEGYGDKAVRALAERCDAVIDDEFAGLTGSGYSPGRVTVTMKDGARHAEAVHEPTGSRATPMDEGAFREKFRASATRAVDEGTAAALYDYLGGLGARGSLDELWPMLRTAD